MKKLIMTLMAILTMTVSAKAMTYEQARNEALFLTDKMAYELNLTDEQYEAAYEINLDYLMGVTGRSDVFGTYWERRNADLGYILLDWQWNAYIAASYFYRPLFWEGGYWHFGIYARYPHRDYFYFGRPHFYATYRGGHAWHRHGVHGYYYERREVYRVTNRSHFGMHDRWTRGDFRGGYHSSTRVTARPSGRYSLGSRRDGSYSYRERSIEGSRYNNGNTNGSIQRSGERSFDRSSNSSIRNRSNASFGARSNASFGGRSSASFGGSSTPSRSFGSNSSVRSSGNSSPSRSFGGGSTSSRSFGGGSSRGSAGGHSGGHYSGGGHSSGNLGGHR